MSQTPANVPTFAPAAKLLIASALQHLNRSSDCLWVAADALSPPSDIAACANDSGATDTQDRRQWTTRTPEALLSQGWQTRYALAVAYLPVTLAPSHAMHLLSSLRDLHARQVLAFIPTTEYGWQTADLLALGMQCHARFAHAEGEREVLMEAWSFDIKTYKAVPDWLNPRFWANPEKWNVFRW